MKILVREMRERRGLSQAELSRRSGVPQAQISIIESGRTQNPTGETLLRLASAMRCAVEDIARLEDATA